MRRASVVASVITYACLWVGVTSASAQKPPPAEAPLEPDRPDVTNGANTVGPGLLQIEFGGIATRSGPADRLFGSPFTARLGLATWLEARVGTDGLLLHWDGTGRTEGLGNILIGAKLRLVPARVGRWPVSILPAINLPTANAQKGLGSGDADYTIALLTGGDLGARSHVDINYGIGAIGAGASQPHFAQHLLSVSVSTNAAQRWSPYAEVFGFSRQSPDGDAAVSFDAGVLYTRSPRLVFDTGLQVGLTDVAPEFGVFAGLSVIVGRTPRTLQAAAPRAGTELRTIRRQPR